MTGRIPIAPERGKRSRVVESSDAEELAMLAKALGHPARVAILRHLLRGGACVCGSIVEILPLAQSTVSQHLKILKDAGLIQGSVDGPSICYCADPRAVKRLQSLLSALRNGNEGSST
jgi:ArsR family transcriptional regulator